MVGWGERYRGKMIEKERERRREGEREEEEKANKKRALLRHLPLLTYTDLITPRYVF